MQKPKDNLGTIIERLRDSMSNEMVKVFENSEFGKVRMMDVNGQIMFGGRVEYVGTMLL